MEKPKFNHMYDIAFTVISNNEEGEDVTGAMLREACLKRLKSVSDEELIEACGLSDTYQMEEENNGTTKE